jgi:formylmethanofuran dehydrogenase subunit E
MKKLKCDKCHKEFEDLNLMENGERLCNKCSKGKSLPPDNKQGVAGF